MISSREEDMCKHPLRRTFCIEPLVAASEHSQKYLCHSRFYEVFRRKTIASQHLQLVYVSCEFKFLEYFKIWYRSIRLQMFFKISVVRNVAILTGKHLCWSLFLIKRFLVSLFLLKRDFNTGVFLWIERNF